MASISIVKEFFVPSAVRPFFFPSTFDWTFPPKLVISDSLHKVLWMFPPLDRKADGAREVFASVTVMLKAEVLSPEPPHMAARNSGVCFSGFLFHRPTTVFISTLHVNGLKKI